MCIRSRIRLQYGERTRALCSTLTDTQAIALHAKLVDCSTFTSVTKHCRTVQHSPNLVSFFMDDMLIGQTVWNEEDLHFRLMAS